MKTIVYLFSILFIVSCGSQQNTSASKDAKGNLVGLASKSDFQQAPFNVWFDQNFDAYTPEATVISQIKPLLKGVKIKAVMGTWCGDSRRETPHFYKILEACNFPMKNLEMITVDRSKKAPNNEQAGLEVNYVPTFIFYKNGVEINRFVEYPIETLEKDILRILKNDGYEPAYFDE